MYVDKKYNDEMMKKIVAHKDFGNRNPVDIGIECGYTEDEVIKMIQTLSEKNMVANEKRGNIIYVFYQEEGKFYIVSVNIDNWKAKAIKEISGFKCRDLYQIKGNFFIWTSDKFTLIWENLETGESGKILMDSDIRRILLLDDAIIILTGHEIIRDEFGKHRTKLLSENSMCFGWDSKLIEGRDEFYVLQDDRVDVVKKDLSSWKELEYESPYGYSILAVEYTEKEGLVWYLYKEEIHIFSSNSYYYLRYSEKDLEGEEGYDDDYPGLDGASASEKNITSISLGVSTKNYKLLQEEIWSKDGRHIICDFERAKEYGDIYDEYGDVYVVVDKDIFIAVSSVPDENSTEIKKIDLQNERRPVVIPVQMH